MRVKWNDTCSDTCSDSFPLLNGVRQGAVLSPILFTILYIDGLLEGLKLSGIGYKRDMKGLIGVFYRRSNAVIANFNMCDSQTLSLYWIELFNFNHKYISDIYVSRRKNIRRIFRAAYRTHNDIIAKLGRYIVSRLDRRLARFLFSLINHDNTQLSAFNISWELQVLII